jgi:phage gp29-like protein
MAKKRRPTNQILPSTDLITVRPEALPEYGQLIEIMQNETASIVSDYIRQWVGSVNLQTPEPGQGIFLNFDRVATTQTYQELAWFDLYAEVERDPHVKAVLDSAKLNVAGMKWDVSAHMNPGEKEPSTRNQAIADATKHALENTGFFPQHLFNLMGALGMGFAVSEIIWEVTNEGVMPKTLINRPPRRFQFDAVDRSLRLRNIKNVYYGDALPDKKFIVHRCSSQWENPFGDAMDQSLYWPWLFKRTVLKFWMQHEQVGAAPIPLVKHPASANKELKAEALSIAQMIRNGAYGRIPDNFEIIWAEAQNAMAAGESYQTFIRTMNDEMSKCVNGQTLTAEASSNVGTGSRALGSIHQVTQNQRDVYRAEGLSSTINASLVKWFVDLNFADVEGYPKFRFDQEEAEDLKTEALVVKTLTDAGYAFDVAELSETFNYTITEKEIPKALTQGLPPKEPPADQGTPNDGNPTEMVERPMTKRTAKFLKEFAEHIEQEDLDTGEKLKEQERELAGLKKSFAAVTRENRVIDGIQKILVRLVDKETIVNVAPPQVTVQPPTVNVSPARVEFKEQQPNIVINVPEQKTPIVNVTVENKGASKELVIERDGLGYIKSIKGK